VETRDTQEGIVLIIYLGIVLIIYLGIVLIIYLGIVLIRSADRPEGEFIMLPNAQRALPNKAVASGIVLIVH